MNLVIQQPRWFIESRGETTGQERSDGMGNGMGGECVRSGREREREFQLARKNNNLDSRNNCFVQSYFSRFACSSPFPLLLSDLKRFEKLHVPIPMRCYIRHLPLNASAVVAKRPCKLLLWWWIKSWKSALAWCLNCSSVSRLQHMPLQVAGIKLDRS